MHKGKNVLYRVALAALFLAPVIVHPTDEVPVLKSAIHQEHHVVHLRQRQTKRRFATVGLKTVSLAGAGTGERFR